MSEVGDTWVPLRKDDAVYTTKQHGNVVVYDGERMEGAIVSLRESSWMIRTDPKVLLDEQEISELTARGAWRVGADFH